MTDKYVPEPHFGSMHSTIIFNTYILYHIFNMIFIKIRDEESIGSMIQQNL